MTVKTAFRAARVNSVRHMEACEKARIRWGEVAITEIVTSRAARATRVLPFTQRAESESGSDWIWWWVDSTAAYGMLVQAKRVTVSKHKWHFDFDYPKGTGTQQSRLMETARVLELVPVYALYLGTGDYRSWAECPEDHQGVCCVACTKRSVSLMPAMLGREMYTYEASVTYGCSVALEEVMTPRAARAGLIPMIREGLAPDLEDFFMTPQYGVRAVGRSMLNGVLNLRMGQGSVASTVDSAELGGEHDRLGPVFPDLPPDTGHWGFPYFEHVLNPLRRAPPSYVLEVESGGITADDLASDMPEGVAGVVVVRLPRTATARRHAL